MLFVPHFAQGCGAKWTLPINHFPGVDRHGYVAYSEQIGELDLGEGFSLPLIIDFQSDRNITSPYLGEGWFFSLDSKFVQIDTNRFLLIQPDAWIRSFHRANENETTLKGQGGWLAKIKGQLTEVYPDCGWKLLFKNGKILSITNPANRQIDFIYRDGRVVEVQEKGISRLKVEFDEVKEKVVALTFNHKRIEIRHGQRPIVDVVAGRNLISRMGRCVSEIHTPSEKKGYLFSTNLSIQPTLEISKEGRVERTFAWDPKSRQILLGDGWRYNIVPSATKEANAAIERTSADGRVREFWHRDRANRREIVQNKGGPIMVTTWFPPSLFKPSIGNQQRIRKVEELVAGKARLKYSASYDEQGVLLREVHRSGIIDEYEWREGGRSVASITRKKDGNVLSIKKYGVDGKRSSYEVVGQRMVTYEDLQGGGRRAVIHFAAKGGGYDLANQEVRLYSSKGELEKKIGVRGGVWTYAREGANGLITAYLNGKRLGIDRDVRDSGKVK